MRRNLLCHTTNFVNKFPKYRVVYENFIENGVNRIFIEKRVSSEIILHL